MQRSARPDQASKCYIHQCLASRGFPVLAALARWRKPRTVHDPAGKAISTEPKDAPSNTLGIRRIMFAVDDIEEVVARLRTSHGAELVGELAQYEDSYRLCYVRGPEGIIVALAEQLS